ncbi:MAG TPA: dihydroneopterin aldolase [Gemmatimonadaceae bacterium]|nr:dihydroneopterin aldolase [Gemmatimonadaceae bacterium]
MYEITLRAMRFHALVGILPHERTTAQPIEVDLRVRVAPGDVVVDYRGLYDLVAGVLNAGPIDYLETIADRVADAALAHNARVRAARVAVRKPHVALGGPLAHAEVVVERQAND